MNQVKCLYLPTSLIEENLREVIIKMRNQELIESAVLRMKTSNQNEI